MNNRSESITKLAPALLKAQKEMGNAVKDSKNPFFKSKFADLNSVREAVTPALHNNGIAILQLNVSDSLTSKTFVRTTLLHESGEFICSDTEILCSKQNDAQAQGSAISYARRYGLSSMLSVGTEDDDGENTMVRQSFPVSKIGKPVAAVKEQTIGSNGPIPTGTGSNTNAFGSFRKGSS